MSKESKKELVAKQGPLGPDERWSMRRKREVVLRLLRGEPRDALSRELGVEIYRLEQWREKAVLGIDEALRDRTGDPLQAELVPLSSVRACRRKSHAGRARTTCSTAPCSATIAIQGTRPASFSPMLSMHLNSNGSF